MVEDRINKIISEAYDTYLNDIFRFCYFKTMNRELSIDLSQKSFLKTLEYMREGNDILNIRAFLYKIAGNMIIDWYRKKREESLDDLLDKGFDPRDSVMETEMYAETRLALKILDKLDPEEKKLITLRYVENLSPKEISIITEERMNTVSVKIHRAMVKLKKLLQEKNKND